MTDELVAGEIGGAVVWRILTTFVIPGAIAAVGLFLLRHPLPSDKDEIIRTIAQVGVALVVSLVVIGLSTYWAVPALPRWSIVAANPTPTSTREGVVTRIVEVPRLPTATFTPSPTATPTSTPTPTAIPTCTCTPTPTLTPTFTATSVSTITPTSTRSPTPSPTPLCADWPTHISKPLPGAYFEESATILIKGTVYQGNPVGKQYAGYRVEAYPSFNAPKANEWPIRIEEKNNCGSQRVETRLASWDSKDRQPGQYTLRITGLTGIFDGNTWKPDGNVEPMDDKCWVRITITSE